jgi:hypothetical protein
MAVKLLPSTARGLPEKKWGKVAFEGRSALHERPISHLKSIVRREILSVEKTAGVGFSEMTTAHRPIPKGA